MAATPSASSEQLRDRVLRPEDRAQLAKPLGDVVSGDAVPSEMARRGAFATCGDVVTAQAISSGLVPFLGVVDGKTLRDRPVDRSAFTSLSARREVSARNPAGQLTADLQRAVRELVETGGGLLWVEGEEDLAVLSLILEMPLGTTVIYGQPGAGACFVRVDADSQSRARAFLERMDIPP